MSEILGGIVHGAEHLLSGAGHALFGGWLPRGRHMVPAEPGQRASVRCMTLARCTMPGCAIRYRSGPDRACPMHTEDGDNLSARMAQFEALSAIPERSADDGGAGGASADDGRSATDGGRQTVDKHGIPRR